jgi:hypothetical protein
MPIEGCGKYLFLRARSRNAEKRAQIRTAFEDFTQASIYKNSDHAGTPENFRASVTGGASGGGGSNFNGSYTATGSCVLAPEGSSSVTVNKGAVRGKTTPQVH